jgi:hypothetical protein
VAALRGKNVKKQPWRVSFVLIILSSLTASGLHGDSWANVYWHVWFMRVLS